MSTKMFSGESMSPAQAAQAVGVSRMTIVRAIESNKIKAFRDNRNNWRVLSESLQAWADAHALISDQKPPVINHVQVEVEVMKERLDAAISRAEAAELDRDAWRSLAEKLAVNHRRKWWPWS